MAFPFWFKPGWRLIEPSLSWKPFSPPPPSPPLHSPVLPPLRSTFNPKLIKYHFCTREGSYLKLPAGFRDSLIAGCIMFDETDPFNPLWNPEDSPSPSSTSPPKNPTWESWIGISIDPATILNNLKRKPEKERKKERSSSSSSSSNRKESSNNLKNSSRVVNRTITMQSVAIFKHVIPKWTSKSNHCYLN